MNLHKWLLITGCCFLISLGIRIYLDVTIYEGTGTPDLRNRVVGARLQQDGISPYFFKWHPGDSLRYYDAHNIGDGGPSNITASPFFHNLMYPLASFKQRTVSRIWLGLEYLFVLVTGIIAFRLAANSAQKIVVLITFGLFLFTETWINHITAGQMYLLLSMLTMVIYYCFTIRDKLPAAFIGGLTTIILLLIKPNMVVFLVPFLFLLNRYSRKYLVAFFIPVILLPVIYFSFESNRALWSSYSKAIPEIIKQHQTDLTAAELEQDKINRSHRMAEYEGWNIKAVTKHEEETNLVLHSENGNVFVFYKYLLHRKMPVSLMTVLSAGSIAVLLLLFFLVRKKFDIITLPNIVLFGYCLYMIVDLFSPINRHQYYGVQWLFPLLLAATVYTPANKWFYTALLAGVLLNVLNTDHIKMEHSIGEYLILITLLGLSVTRKLGSAIIKEK